MLSLSCSSLSLQASFQRHSDIIASTGRGRVIQTNDARASKALDNCGTGSDIMATKYQPSQSAKTFSQPTYRFIEARMADARCARGAMLGWHALWPPGIAAGIGVALLAIGTVRAPADRTSHFSSP